MSLRNGSHGPVFFTYIQDKTSRVQYVKQSLITLAPNLRNSYYIFYFSGVTFKAHVHNITSTLHWVATLYS